MTPERNDKSPDDLENGVLTTGSIDTAGIGLAAGPTAQVDVDLPTLADEDDDYLADDDIVVGEGRQIVFVDPARVLDLDLADLARQVLPGFLDSALYRDLAGRDGSGGAGNARLDP